MKKIFTEEGTFKAFNAATKWCKDNGFSVGSMQRDAPIGLMRGDYQISKWRNLRKQEIYELDGKITGDKWNGPVWVEIFNTDDAPQ